MASADRTWLLVTTILKCLNIIFSFSEEPRRLYTVQEVVADGAKLVDDISDRVLVGQFQSPDRYASIVS